MDDDEIEYVGVDDAVQSVAAERTDLEHLLCPVDRHAHLHALVLEEQSPVLPVYSCRNNALFQVTQRLSRRFMLNTTRRKTTAADLFLQTTQLDAKRSPCFEIDHETYSKE